MKEAELVAPHTHIIPPETVQVLFTIRSRPRTRVVGGILTHTLLRPVGVIVNESFLSVNNGGRFETSPIELCNPHTLLVGEVFTLLFQDDRLEGDERQTTVTLVCQCSADDAALLHNAPIDALKLELSSMAC
jgi:hypothetical protein